MKLVQLTALKRYQLKDIEQAVIPASDETNRGFKGSTVTVKLEDNPYASLRRGERLALSVWCKGQRIGYVPEIATLRGYAEENRQKGYLDIAKLKDAQADAAEAFRDQLFCEYDNDYTKTEWQGHVHDLLYAKDGVHGMIKFDAYSKLCQDQPEEAKDWHLTIVSIGIED